MNSVFLFALSVLVSVVPSQKVSLSEQTQACIGCHNQVTPGIVHDWMDSRHSRTAPGAALKKPAPERRISNESIPEPLKKTAVGCYECHSRNNESHKDAFAHFGFQIHVIVTPNDCATCHRVERDQYIQSKKSYAYSNLMGNPLYHALADTVISVKTLEDTRLVRKPPSPETRWDTCLGCHGTEVGVEGMKTISTAMGDMEVPDLRNWPNQGVGRVNPDGSRGACTSCHSRHAFSIAEARKPYTCAQCHLEPDVPAWDVYRASKHGNIFLARGEAWNFENVPWRPGKDFRAPTCAVCHNSLLTKENGEVIAERTHNFGSRLWVRLFGLPYAHAQPITGATSVIKNKYGLPLPTTFLNEPAGEYLISTEEMQRREAAMKAVCNSCHNRQWIDGHFARFANTVKETNEMTLTATKLLLKAWEEKIADKSNPFDEEIEILWVKQWLFYANTARYASAMTGAQDYTSFEHGWWDLSDNLQKILSKLKK